MSSESQASDTPILECKDLCISYFTRAGEIPAVIDFNLSLSQGDSVGLVGESGCGKSTLGRMVAGILEPTSGEILFAGEGVSSGSEQAREAALKVQMIFQDPFASLNPRMPVRDIIAEPLRIHGASKTDASEKVSAVLEAVGLLPEHGNRYPHEFSGGQRQRIGIARALALEPKIIVLDEPVSALDVSVQAQVLNLLEELQEEFELSYLFIAHDLSVVEHISNRVAVMYLGKIAETAPSGASVDA